MCFAEVDRDGVLPAVPLTERLVEGGADEHAPALGHIGLRRRQQVVGRWLGLGFSVLLALLHTQVQSAIFVHLYEHVLQTEKLNGNRSTVQT